MKRNVIETVLGAVVIVVAAIFLGFAYFSSDLRPVAGYTIRAKFNAIDGLVAGNDVRIGGVKVGTVVGAALDPQDYRAVVTMTEIGRAHVRTPVTKAHLVCSILPEKKN